MAHGLFTKFKKNKTKKTQCMNHFDAKLIKIHSAVIEILSISSSVLFLVMADGAVFEHKTAKITRGPMALNRSPEYTGQSQTFNFEI